MPDENQIMTESLEAGKEVQNAIVKLWELLHNFKEHHNALNKQKADLETHFARVVNGIDEQENLTRNYKKKNNELELRLVDLENENINLVEKVDELEQKLKSDGLFDNQIHSLSSENNELKEKLLTLQELNVIIDEINNELDSEKAKNQELQQKVIDVKNDNSSLEKLQEELEFTKKEISRQNIELHKRSTEISSLKDTISNQNNKLLKLAKIEADNLLLNEKISQLDEIKSSIDSEVETHKQKAEELEAKLISFQQLNDDLITKKDNEITLLENVIKENVRKNTESVKQRKLFELKLQNALEFVRVYNTEVNNLKEEINKNNNESIKSFELESMYEAISNSYEVLNEKYKELTLLNLENENKISELSQLVESLNAQLRVKDDSIKGLNSINTQLNDRINGDETIISELNNKLKESKNELLLRTNKLEESFETIKEFRTKLSELEIIISENNESGTRIRSLNDTIDSLNIEIDNLNRAITEAKNKLILSESKLSDMKSEFINLEREKQVLTDEITKKDELLSTFEEIKSEKSKIQFELNNLKMAKEQELISKPDNEDINKLNETKFRLERDIVIMDNRNKKLELDMLLLEEEKVEWKKLKAQLANDLKEKIDMIDKLYSGS